MYFWRIDSLKRDLAAQTIEEKQALPYLLWLGGLTTLASSLPLGELNRWDVATALSSVGLFLGGTWYAFRCNDGSAGDEFLVRYLTITWVVGLRLLLMLGIPLIVSGILLEELLFEPVPSDTTPIMAAVLIAFESTFYWRLTTHIREVATASLG